MTEVAYFFDTYAIREIILGNKNYEKYTNSKVVITKLNLFEIFYIILRDVDEKEANEICDKYYKFIVDFDDKLIKEAAKFRFILKKREVSMTDCIGYILAKKLGIKFLTGDKEFEYLNNVEFVK